MKGLCRYRITTKKAMCRYILTPSKLNISPSAEGAHTMKQHKVIVEVIEHVQLSRYSFTGEHVATFERIYPSKSAAINNAREIAQSGVFKRFRDGNGDLSYKYYFKVHVEDMDGNAFNYCLNAGVSDDFDDLRNVHELTADDAITMLKARCFSRLML